MRGFEPRSRHHDSSTCSPLHHTGKEQLLSYPRDSALLRFVRPEPTRCGIYNRSTASNRHLYFTTRGLVGSSCERWQFFASVSSPLHRSCLLPNSGACLYSLLQQVGPRHVCQPQDMLRVPSHPLQYAPFINLGLRQGTARQNLHIQPKPSRKYASQIRNHLQYRAGTPAVHTISFYLNRSLGVPIYTDEISTLPTQGWVSNT